MGSWDTYRALPVPVAPHRYCVERSARSWRVGRTVEGFPAILFAVPPGVVSSPRRLVHLWYAPPASVELVGDDGAREHAQVAVLECRTSDQPLCEYFLRIVDAVLVEGAAINDGIQIERALDRLVALFRALLRPGLRTVEGLWAELAMIAWSRDPGLAVTAWHSEPRALYDFSAGPDKLEVKATLRPVREHTFKLDQVAVESGGATVIASLMLTAGDHGVSVFDLMDEIRLRAATMSGIGERLDAVVVESLGEGWREAGGVRFLQEPARASLRLFHADAIPTIPRPLPPEIKDVRYVVDMSTTPALELAVARQLGTFLFGALLPESGPSVRGAP